MTFALFLSLCYMVIGVALFCSAIREVEQKMDVNPQSLVISAFLIILFWLPFYLAGVVLTLLGVKNYFETGDGE